MLNPEEIEELIGGGLQALGVPLHKFEITATCHTCHETQRAVQGSPSRELLEQHYTEAFRSGDALGHPVIVTVKEVPSSTKSHVNRVVKYEPDT